MTVDREVLTLPKNHDAVREAIEDRQPLPYRCACGLDAIYGAAGKWYCTRCWQADLSAKVAA